MKTFFYKDLAEFISHILYLENEDQDALYKVMSRRERWNALDVLSMDWLGEAEKLRVVLLGELIDALVLHEFACRCAERALSWLENPDPRSLRAIEVKRMWLKGEATDAELESARDAARDASRCTSWYYAWHAAYQAAKADARDAAWYAAYEIDYPWQVETLQNMLKEQQEAQKNG